MPVTIYPKEYVDQILTDVSNVQRNVAAGQQPLFNSIEDLIASLEGDEF